MFERLRNASVGNLILFFTLTILGIGYILMTLLGVGTPSKEDLQNREKYTYTDSIMVSRVTHHRNGKHRDTYDIYGIYNYGGKSYETKIGKAGHNCNYVVGDMIKGYIKNSNPKDVHASFESTSEEKRGNSIIVIPIILFGIGIVGYKTLQSSDDE